MTASEKQSDFFSRHRQALECLAKFMGSEIDKVVKALHGRVGHAA